LLEDTTDNPNFPQMRQPSPSYESMPIDLPVGSLAHKTASGFGWMLAQTAVGKIVNFVGTIVLGWLLAREQFGSVSLAVAIVTFANLIQEAGIHQILVQGGARFNRMANAAFWMSNVTGLLGGAIMAIAAPIAAHVLHNPQLTGLILILAARCPINALSTVPNAKLNIDLRFGTLAVIGTALTTVQVVLSIGLAWILPPDQGAYSLVWPLLAVAILRAIILWRVAPTTVRPDVEIGLWGSMIGDSVVLLLVGFFVTITSQGDRLILGRMHDKVVVGIYYYAYTLTLQTTQFLTVNLYNVLFPALSKLQSDPARQLRGFLRACRLLMLFGMPLCLLQAALAAPMVRVLFKSDWLPMIPVLEVISVAMGLQLVNMPAIGMIQAQGRFKTLLAISVMCALLFVGLVYTAALTGNYQGSLTRPGLSQMLERLFHREVDVATMVAMAVLVYCTLISPICLFASIRPVGGTWRDIWPVFLLPLGLSIAAIGIGMLVGRYVPVMHSSHLYDWARLLVISAVSGLVYIPLLRLTAPDAWKDVTQRVRAMLAGGK